MRFCCKTVLCCGVVLLPCLSSRTGAASASIAEAKQDAAIAKLRMGTLEIKAKPGARVTVTQKRHEFWFGAALASHMFGSRMSPKQVAMYKKRFLENFNAAVTENALKWRAMERVRGRVDYTILDSMLDWTEANHIPLRGHCLFWGVRNFIQPWVKALDDEGLEQILKQRAITIARRFRGRIAEYDLNNEMLHQNFYRDRLGPDITLKMARWVRQGDPDAVIYVNDYDILTGRLVDRYAKQIDGFIKAGVPLGGIGVQGHLHGETFDPAALKKSLDILAQFKLPVRITEFNMPGQRSRFHRNRNAQLTPEEEAKKAEQLVSYYRICFAHPAVEGILMWGFWAGGNWIPVSSLYKRDWTPTPAAHAYRKLVFDTWWTRWQGKADAEGRCTVPAFYGQHSVSCSGRTKTISLTKKQGMVTVDLR